MRQSKQLRLFSIEQVLENQPNPFNIFRLLDRGQGDFCFQAVRVRTDTCKSTDCPKTVWSFDCHSSHFYSRGGVRVSFVRWCQTLLVVQFVSLVPARFSVCVRVSQQVSLRSECEMSVTWNFSLVE